jgi:hypothetical protein
LHDPSAKSLNPSAQVLHKSAPVPSSHPTLATQAFVVVFKMLSFAQVVHLVADSQTEQPVPQAVQSAPFLKVPAAHVEQSVAEVQAEQLALHAVQALFSR